MDHPLIPPHCPYFQTQDDRLGMLWFSASDYKKADFECTHCLTIESAELTLMRPIIAAVARCAWNDLPLDRGANVAWSTWYADECAKGTIKTIYALWEEYRAIQAEAWRMWGLNF